VRVEVRESCEERRRCRVHVGSAQQHPRRRDPWLCISYLRHEKLVVDLVDVESVSAHAVNAWVEGQLLLEQAGCELVLRGASPQLRRTFELNDPASILTFQEQEQESGKRLGGRDDGGLRIRL